MITVETKTELKSALKSNEEVIQIVGNFADEIMNHYGSSFRNFSQVGPMVGGPLVFTPLITTIVGIEGKLKKYSIEKYEKGSLLTIIRR